MFLTSCRTSNVVTYSHRKKSAEFEIFQYIRENKCWRKEKYRKEEYIGNIGLVMNRIARWTVISIGLLLVTLLKEQQNETIALDRYVRVCRMLTIHWLSSVISMVSFDFAFYTNNSLVETYPYVIERAVDDWYQSSCRTLRKWKWCQSKQQNFPLENDDRLSKYVKRCDTISIVHDRSTRTSKSSYIFNKITAVSKNNNR
jgi:hypothetical protein